MLQFLAPLISGVGSTLAGKALGGGGSPVGSSGSTQVQTTNVTTAPNTQTVNIGASGFGGVPMGGGTVPADFVMPFSFQRKTELFSNSTLMLLVLAGVGVLAWRLRK